MYGLRLDRTISGYWYSVIIFRKTEITGRFFSRFSTHCSGFKTVDALAGTKNLFESVKIREIIQYFSLNVTSETCSKTYLKIGQVHAC